MKMNQKILFPSIIAIITLIILVSGATYAYMTVSTVNNSKTITGTATYPPMGAVAISSGTNLSLQLTRPLLMKMDTNKTYYATTNGTPSETQTAPAIGVITVTGPGTFTCYYTLQVNMTGTLYDAFKNMNTKSDNQLILTINGQDYDFNSTTDFVNGFSITGSFSGLTQSSPKDITAQFRFVNRSDVIQDALADKNVTFTFTVPSFRCDANF